MRITARSMFDLFLRNANFIVIFLFNEDLLSTSRMCAYSNQSNLTSNMQGPKFKQFCQKSNPLFNLAPKHQCRAIPVSRILIEYFISIFKNSACQISMMITVEILKISVDLMTGGFLNLKSVLFDFLNIGNVMYYSSVDFHWSSNSQAIEFYTKTYPRSHPFWITINNFDNRNSISNNIHE